MEFDIRQEVKILYHWAHSHFPGVLYQFFCLEYSKWVGKRIKNRPFGRVQLIIQKKMNLSFIAFFEPSTTKIK